MRTFIYIFLSFIFVSFILAFSTRFINFETFNSNDTTVKFNHYIEKDIHFLEGGNELSDTFLIFIHGSPGTWKAFGPYLKNKNLYNRVKMISLDRLGYGETKKEASFSLNSQAKLFEYILKKIGIEKFIVLVAHSYGGAVATKTALMYSNYIDKLFLIAPCLAPQFQKNRWYNYLLKVFPYRYLISNDIKASNTEMFELSEELELLEENLYNIKIPITVIQGKKDWLVNPETVDYISENYINAELEIIEGDFGHFVIWEKPDWIINLILK